MQKEQQQLAELVKGKKVAFIGAGVSHKTLIEEFVGLGAHVTLCDKKNSVDDFGSYAETIRRLGIDGFAVRQGKRFELTFDGEATTEVLAQIEHAATALLSNPVIEDVVNVAVLDEADGAR